jgi:hypothetical protein
MTRYVALLRGTNAGVVRHLNPMAAKDRSVRMDDFFPGVLAFFQPKSTTPVSDAA